MHNESNIDWNIPLNFDIPAVKPAAPITPLKVKQPPREVLKAKFPRILDRVNLLWGTLELDRYLQETLLTDRSGRQGFPSDVMEALGQINNEHQQVLMKSGLLRQDVWDMQMRGK